MRTVVLITGARSGFGKLATLEALRRGHTVYAGLRDLSTADQTLRESGATLLQLDVTDADQREAAVATVLEAEGQLDALVNNAGIALGGFLETIDEDEIRYLFEVNLFGVWALTKAVLPAMRRQQRGSVIMISSMSGRHAWPALGAYASSKFALEGLSEAWRQELLPFGIQVTLVEPGPYKTDIFERNRNIGRDANRPDSPYAELAARLERLEAKVGPRMGDAQDVADRIVSILADPDPPFRNPLGPTTRVRRLARWLLPPGAFEGVIRGVIRRA